MRVAFISGYLGPAGTGFLVCEKELLDELQAFKRRLFGMTAGYNY